MEESTGKRYREPNTVYSFTTSADLPSSAPLIVVGTGKHAAAYLLNSLPGKYTDWNVTTTKGERITTVHLGKIYTREEKLVVIVTGKVDEYALIPSMQYLFSTVVSQKVLVLDSMLLSDYIGSPSANLVCLSNRQGQSLPQVSCQIESGNMLSGVSAAVLLVCEALEIPCSAAIALTPDHVLSSSTCHLFAPTGISPSPDGSYIPGISVTEQTLHNIYI